MVRVMDSNPGDPRWILYNTYTKNQEKPYNKQRFNILQKISSLGRLILPLKYSAYNT